MARRRRGRPSVRCSQPEGGAPAPGTAEEQGEWEGEELEGEEEGEEEGRGEEQARRARCMCACRRGARVSPFFPFIFFCIFSLIDMTWPLPDILINLHASSSACNSAKSRVVTF